MDYKQKNQKIGENNTPPVLHVLKQPGEINLIIIHYIEMCKIKKLLLIYFSRNDHKTNFLKLIQD